ERRGAVLPPATEGAAIRLAYRGLDDVTRTTTIAFTPAPQHIEPGGAEYQLLLLPGASVELTVAVSAASAPGSTPRPVGYGEALRRRRGVVDGVDRDAAEVFFFSSRRRHTRWPRDWSSDVCSSD